MSISFGGIGSGLPVSDWIDAIMQGERRPVDNLYTKKTTTQKTRTSLNSMESKFSSLRSAIEKLTDSKMSSAFDLFTKKAAKSSDDDILTATVTNQAAIQKVKVKVENLASATKAQSYYNNVGSEVTSSTKITELGNGQGTTGNISIYIKGVKKEIEIEKDDTLADVASKINGDGLTATVENGKFKIVAANLTKDEVKFGSNSDTSNFFNITQLATAVGVESGSAPNINTTFASINSLSAINTSGTLMGTTTGSFTLKVNGANQVFNITTDPGQATQPFFISSEATLSEVAQKISDANIGVTASVEDNKLKLTYDKTVVTSFSVGADTDTSNFLKKSGLKDATSTTNGDNVTLTGSNAIEGKILDSATANLSQRINAGTFTIGKAEFTIDDNTTLSDLISRINSNDDAGVIANIDVISNKLVLTSKNPGNVAINLEDGTSNFLTSMGLINLTGETLASQALGKNAKVYINDSAVALEATSNTLSSDITGINGLTINLNKVSEGETVDVDISQDTKQLTDAVESFITKFNEVINEIDKSTSSTGDLKSEYSLVRFKNDLRMSATTSTKGLSKYDSLSMIGISSGSVGSGKDANVKNLTLDKNKFLDALSKNPSEVKSLLVGDKAKGITGILENLEQKVENALNPTEGYFATREESLNKSIADIERSIESGEVRLKARRETLVRQFTQMDQIISKMKSQGSGLF